jgi:uncharacterized membrane protein YcaP (DUF421 family)
MSPAFIYFLTTVAARTAIILLWLIVGLRMLGKRQIGQMNIYDLALVMALSNCVQNAMTHGNGNLSVGIVSASTLLGIGWIITMIFVRVPKLEERIVGSPTVLIHDGQVQKQNLRREHVTENELMTAVRLHGLGSTNEVLLSVLEVDGSISVIPRTAVNHRIKKGAKYGHGHPKRQKQGKE